ncbi:MAG: S8 family serine peptidase [Candidatus Thorarchaeota archaeon]
MTTNPQMRGKKKTGIVPGIIGVRFNDAARIRLKANPSGNQEEFVSESKTIDLSGLNTELHRIQYKKIIKIFDYFPKKKYVEYFERQKKEYQKKGKITPPTNLNNVFSIIYESKEEPETVIERFKKLSTIIEDAYPKYTIATPSANCDPTQETHYPAQWYLHRCKIDQAWKCTKGKGVVVANIDAGFFIDHKDLISKFPRDPQGELINAFNSYDGSKKIDSTNHRDPDLSGVNQCSTPRVWDQRAHGTKSSGMISGECNDFGIVGVAYECDIWPIQAARGDGPPLVPCSETAKPWVNAIQWFIDQPYEGRKVINLELSFGPFYTQQGIPYFVTADAHPDILDAIMLAISEGIVVCIPAGNSDWDVAKGREGNPIPDSGAIIVAATAKATGNHPNPRLRPANTPGYESNWGERVDVAAPGDPTDDKSSSDNSQGFDNFGGTSGAVCKVTGTVALMLSCNSSLTPDRVRNVIRETRADTVERETDANGNTIKPIGGFLDAEAAVWKVCTIPCMLSKCIISLICFVISIPLYYMILVMPPFPPPGPWSYLFALIGILLTGAGIYLALPYLKTKLKN